MRIKSTKATEKECRGTKACRCTQPWWDDSRDGVIRCQKCGNILAGEKTIQP